MRIRKAAWTGVAPYYNHAWDRGIRFFMHYRRPWSTRTEVSVPHRRRALYQEGCMYKHWLKVTDAYQARFLDDSDLMRKYMGNRIEYLSNMRWHRSVGEE